MDPEQTVREWALAERTNDASKLEGLLAEDFAAIGPRGFQLDKQQWVGRFRSGSYLNRSFEWDEVDVRRYDSTAVVRGVQTSTGAYDGQPVGGKFRGTQVYVQQDGAWKLAAMQLSEMAEPPAGGPPR